METSPLPKPMHEIKTAFQSHEQYSNAQKHFLEFVYHQAQASIINTAIKEPPQELTRKRDREKFVRDQYRVNYNQLKPDIRDRLADNDLNGVLDITRLNKADIDIFLQTQGITPDHPSFNQYRDFLTRSVRTANNSINFRASAEYVQAQESKYQNELQGQLINKKGQELKGTARIRKEASLIREIQYGQHDASVTEKPKKPSYAEILLQELENRIQALETANNQQLEVIIDQIESAQQSSPIQELEHIAKGESLTTQPEAKYNWITTIRAKFSEVWDNLRNRITTNREANVVRKLAEKKQQERRLKYRREFLKNSLITGVAVGKLATEAVNLKRIMDLTEEMNQAADQIANAKKMSDAQLNQIATQKPIPTQLPPEINDIKTDITPTSQPPDTNPQEVKDLVKPITTNLENPSVINKLYEMINKIRSERANKDPEYLRRINTELNNGRVNILLMGLDIMDQGTQRADALLVLSYDVKTNQAKIISIPRSLHSPEVDQMAYVANPDFKKKNLSFLVNGMSNFGKGDDFRRIVEDMTGLSVDAQMQWNFDGFKKIIDTVGGVKISIDQNFIDNYGHYKEFEVNGTPMFKKSGPGIYTFNAAQALQYARVRKADTIYERGNRQMEVAKALVKKMTETVKTQPAEGIKLAFQLLTEQNNNFSKSTEINDFQVLELLTELGKNTQQINQITGIDVSTVDPGWVDTAGFKNGVFAYPTYQNKNGDIVADTSQLWPKKYTGKNSYNYSPKDKSYLDYWDELRTRVKTTLENARILETAGAEPLPANPKIMVMGDSTISSGLIPTYLNQKLSSAGISSEFIGDMNTAGNQVFHEGHAGFNTQDFVDQLTSNKWKVDGVEKPNNFSKNVPHVCVVTLGLNDAAICADTQKRTGIKMDISQYTIPNLKKILNYIKQKNPHVRILLSQVTPSTDPLINGYVKQINSHIIDLVKNSNSKISPVVTTKDLERDILNGGISEDKIHLTSKGQKEMADIYAEALKQLIQS